MKKLVLLALTLTLCLGLTACDSVSNAVAGVGQGLVQEITGHATGEVGKSYKTQWFTFSVNSLDAVTEFEGSTAPDGYVFLVADVTEKNTWEADESIPMYASDFELVVGDETFFAEIPWSENMMPEEFELAPDEEITAPVAFLIPADTKDVKFIYVEIDENNDVGVTFTINHTL